VNQFDNKRFARQDYDRQVVASSGAATADYNSAGPPSWSKPAWDAFHAQYGRWPFTVEELPTSFAGAPDWVYERMNIRKPPITVIPT
jgi:hypothetical protein